MAAEVEKAEQMFLDALAEKGMRIEQGRIIGSEDEENTDARPKSQKPTLDQRTFSYNEIVAKGSLKGVVIKKNQQVPTLANGSIDIKAMTETVRKQCHEIQVNGGGRTYFLEAPDIDRNVRLTEKGITHGFKSKKKNHSAQKDFINARAMLEYANILQNSIEVNRKDGRGNDDILFSRVMVGTVGMEDRNGTIEYYAVRSVVEERINQDPVLVSFDILGNLHAANAKKVDPINHRGVKQITTPSGTMVAYEYSIPHFLKDVKSVFDDTFSKDVYNHLGMQRNESPFANGLKYSKKVIKPVKPMDNRPTEANLPEDPRVLELRGDQRKALANWSRNKVYTRKANSQTSGKPSASPSEVSHLTAMQKQTVANYARTKVYTKADSKPLVP